MESGEPWRLWYRRAVKGVVRAVKSAWCSHVVSLTTRAALEPPPIYTGWLIALSYDISYTLCSPSEFHAKQIYVKNKAGLTGQTVPGRRIPGHWPTPVPEALAVAEPVTLVKG